MANSWYPASDLIGGGTGALDLIDGVTLNDGDRALVITADTVYFYILDATSAATESSPDIISPDSNAGDKRWILSWSTDDSAGVTGMPLYAYSALIGGTTGTLDSLDGTDLSDGDKAIVTTADTVYFYNLDATSAAAESSPDIIAPDANGGDKRWILAWSTDDASDVTGDPLYSASVLSGGGVFSLDLIDGTDLTEASRAMVTTEDTVYFYRMDTDSGATESSPDVISPDTNAGSKRWVLVTSVSTSLLGSPYYKDSGDAATGTHTVTALRSFVFGIDHTLTEASGETAGECAILSGRLNSITEFDTGYSVICGGRENEIESNYSAILGGRLASATLHGQNAYASGAFFVAGDAQYSTVIAKNSTTNATAASLFLDGSSENMVLPASTSWRFTISLIASQTGGSSGTVGDSAFWTVTGGIKRDGSNNTALIGTPQGTGTPGSDNRDAVASAWSVAVTADDTNECLKITVTGEADKNIRWVAKIELTEVGLIIGGD